MRRDLPTGTVTFLFTDIEGSTRLLDELGAEAYAEALAEHRASLPRGVARATAGWRWIPQGDAFFVAFPTARRRWRPQARRSEALTAARSRVRMGMHTGEPHLADEGYVGVDVHRAARIAAAGARRPGRRLGGDGRGARRSDGLRRARRAPAQGFRRAGPDLPARRRGASRRSRRSRTRTCRGRRARSSGRERELAEVLALLEDGARLVTLTGPGGSGKTRLALEAAATLVPEFKAGVFWVGLAALRDPALVTRDDRADARRQGRPGRAHRRARDAAAARQPRAGDRGGARAVRRSSRRARTSRCSSPAASCCGSRRGRVPGAPLAEPEAVALFCERAQAEPTRRDRASCARASTTCRWRSSSPPRGPSVLSPAQILERLSQRLDLLKGGRDADPRQQTLRATIEWSYDLLDADEQRLFARCPCSPAAARSRPPRRSPTPTSTPCSHSSTRASLRFTNDALLDARDDPRVRRRASTRVSESG